MATSASPASTAAVQPKAAPGAKNPKGSDNTLLSTVMGNLRQYGIVGALIIIVVAFQILTGGVLLKPNSFVSLIQQNAYVIILAIGMVMVIIATHIDLSVGSLVAFIGGVCALLMEHYNVNWIVAIVVSIILGLLIGIWNGFWVAYVRIPGFITTLAGMLIFRGLATVIVGESVPITSRDFRGIASNYIPNFLGFGPGGMSILTIVVGALVFALFVFLQFRNRAKVAASGLQPEPMSLTWIKIVVAGVVIAFVTYLLSLSGNDENGGIPIMLVIVGVLVVIYNFILTRTVFGRHVYAVGGNRKAARLSGIDDRKVDFFLYVHMGFLSAVAAVCMLSRLASATAQAGMEFEMDAIAACFIGGTAVTGGIGTIPGAVVGAFVMGVINQGLSIMGVDTAIVKTIKGLVLLGAVAVDLMSKRKKG
ncbi:multiple monosaccharide ABC transporter permease [Alloscardovia macacae]|uniref:Xylose transport system permease protein XylH n=1 Tax=Alloscardovia macacae TaxID=1160091 RepID=A0A261F6J4_9BIFI|nr:multiple monosaccharide ABC transporter permease [Alloscardovia macacae]OZG54752.1 ABC transporter permease [Alloscardovia macacae]